MPRFDLRAHDELRSVLIERGYLKHNPHSVMISFGDTKVLCTATLDKDVPRFKKNSGEGWLTAEYAMLPCCSPERIQRERSKVGGRTQEIQRLIGRALRSVMNFKALGEKTILVDADVIQADGGTRTASITGACIAVRSLLTALRNERIISADPFPELVAAISVGMVDGEAVLDLPYNEDSQAEVDMNVVMTESGKFIEIQGTAEHAPFTKIQMDQMVALAEKGIRELFVKQKEALIK